MLRSPLRKKTSSRGCAQSSINFLSQNAKQAFQARCTFVLCLSTTIHAHTHEHTHTQTYTMTPCRDRRAASLNTSSTLHTPSKGYLVPVPGARGSSSLGRPYVHHPTVASVSSPAPRKVVDYARTVLEDAPLAFRCPWDPSLSSSSTQHHTLLSPSRTRRFGILPSFLLFALATLHAGRER